MSDPLSCSFCGKLETEVKAIIVGPDVYICNECVELCIDILKEDRNLELVREVPAVESFYEFWGTDL